MSLAQLSAKWLEAKAREAQATKDRRDIEDQMKVLMEMPETFEGTKTFKPGGYVVKYTGRINRKVNGDKLQELAIEHGLTDHLSSLFRWKPEINMAIWKSTDEAITKPLAAAITAKPGRPSFTIEPTTIKE